MSRSHEFLSLTFIAIIFIFGIFNFKNSNDKIKIAILNSVLETEEQLKATVSNVELIYTDNFIFHDKFMDAYGLSQRLLNRYVIGNRDVYSDKQHKLHFHETEWYNDSFINNAIELKKYIEDLKILFLYVATPSKTIEGYTKLPDSIDVSANANLDKFVSTVQESNINVLDLRDGINEGKFKAKNFFYTTDHHWTNEAAFWAFGNIIDN